jgi:hypothetical protein
MTVKDLVSTHTGVIYKHDNIKVTVIVYRNKDEYSPELSVDEAIKKYGMKTVKEWFQTRETTYNGTLIGICILIEEEE